MMALFRLNCSPLSRVYVRTLKSHIAQIHRAGDHNTTGTATSFDESSVNNFDIGESCRIKPLLLITVQSFGAGSRLPSTKLVLFLSGFDYDDLYLLSFNSKANIVRSSHLRRNHGVR